MNATEAYKQGYLDGITCFAWHHPDGHQEVGTTGKTLKKAKEQLETLWNYYPPTKDEIQDG